MGGASTLEAPLPVLGMRLAAGARRAVVGSEEEEHWNNHDTRSND